MRLRAEYDVIFAGGGLSSFLCGALLARRGKKVLVIEDPDRAVSRRYGPGYVFDPDFSGFSGLGETAALGKSIRELGIDEGLFLESEAEPQVLTPDYRIKFPSDAEALALSIKNEIRVGGGQIGEFFGLLARASTEVPSFVESVLTRGQGTTAQIAEWRRFWGPYYRLMQTERPVPLVGALADGIALQCESIGSAILGATSFAAPMNLGCEQSLRGLSLAMRRQSYVVGGQEAFLHRLGEIITAAGGTVKRHTRVEGLIAESSRISGVLLSSFEGIIRSETVVVCGQIRRIYSTLPEGMKDRALLRSLNRVIPASWRFTISVTVNREAIALGATEFMTYIGSFQAPFEEENYLRIQTIPGATEEEATLLVTALVPYRASTLDYGYLRRLGGKMLHVLSGLMPFLDQSIVAIYPDFRASEDDLRECYSFSGAEWLPENLMHYYLRGERQAQDFWGPSWTTPHAGLYFAGRAIWPALGSYGEALAARRIYDDVISPDH